MVSGVISTGGLLHSEVGLLEKEKICHRHATPKSNDVEQREQRGEKLYLYVIVHEGKLMGRA